MTDNQNHRVWQCVQVALGVTLSSAACVVEKIDAMLAEHGATYSGDDGSLDTSSTGTSSTSTSTSETADSETSGHSGAMESSTTAASGSGTSDGGSSTGPMGAVCGDGVVQGDETCDDGNATPDDGCQECAKDSIVFISSEAYQGYALEGLYGADQRCRSLAAKAKLQRAETFRAWLSTPSMAVADRLRHSRGRYTLVNGLVIAQDWDALASGTLGNPIVVDEYSLTQDTPVWTGTLANGQPAIGSEFCGDWDSAPGPVIFGGSGLSSSTDSTWSFVMQASCDDENRLYCVEQ